MHDCARVDECLKAGANANMRRMLTLGRYIGTVWLEFVRPLLLAVEHDCTLCVYGEF